MGVTTKENAKAIYEKIANHETLSSEEEIFVQAMKEKYEQGETLRGYEAKILWERYEIGNPDAPTEVS